MRFLTGTIVSTLILSPISVLSMALDTSANSITQVSDGSTYSEVAISNDPVASTLKKRFCLIGCSKKHGSGYQCNKKFFSQKKIQKAKNVACPRIKENKQKNAFPSLHTATKYDIPGPYLEWPIKRNGKVWNTWSKSRYRIVLTQNCKVVGVVIRKGDASYSKCKHIDGDEDEDEDEDDD